MTTFVIEAGTSLPGLPGNEYAEVKVSFGLAGDDEVLEHAFRSLRPQGKVLVQGVPTREAGNAISTDLRIQGFTEVMVAKDGEERFVVATKPADLTVGAAASISLPTASKWTMDTTDLADSDLVDERALLDDSDLAASRETKESSCGPGEAGGKKRACKNCSCGLAEREALENASDAAPIDPVAKASSCGGCYKGDAFRCAGCPFLGKPAFEPGQERLVLSLSDDI